MVPLNDANFGIGTLAADQLAHDLGGVVDHRDHARIVEPRRADHADDADDAPGPVAIRRDDGAPGLRPRYHASYYGAFVLDPDGNNIEAVYRA